MDFFLSDPDQIPDRVGNQNNIGRAGWVIDAV
jgi:hypothetical protein